MSSEYPAGGNGGGGIFGYFVSLFAIAYSPEGFRIWKTEKQSQYFQQRRQLIAWAHLIRSTHGMIALRSSP
jgi:hypothetical protein